LPQFGKDPLGLTAAGRLLQRGAPVRVDGEGGLGAGVLDGLGEEKPLGVAGNLEALTPPGRLNSGWMSPTDTALSVNRMAAAMNLPPAEKNNSVPSRRHTGKFPPSTETGFLPLPAGMDSRMTCWLPGCVDTYAIHLPFGAIAPHVSANDSDIDGAANSGDPL
jgi:hypothetical protein